MYTLTILLTVNTVILGIHAISFKAAILSAHNRARARNSPPVPPLKWDNDLAKKAQDWANSCPRGHNPKRGYTGENMWGISHSNSNNLPSSSTAASSAVKAWLGERDWYNKKTYTCDKNHQCGHYTQLVWKDSNNVGCGFKKCGNNEVIVCNYSPPGNFRGEHPFKRNSDVLKRIAEILGL